MYPLALRGEGWGHMEAQMGSYGAPNGVIWRGPEELGGVEEPETMGFMFAI